MKTAEVKQDIKLGIFVVAGVLLFILAAFFIGSENNLFSRTITVMAVFKNVEGLKRGDNVWLSGVKIGTVRDVNIASEGKVLVTMLLKEKQNEFIRRDAMASVGSDGLVGNKIVVIRPGTAPENIADNDTINSLSPTDTQDLINIAKDVGENTRSLTFDLKELSRRVSDGQGIVGDLITDKGSFSHDLRQTATNLRQVGANMNRASAELNALVYEMKHGEGVIHKLVSDTTMATVFDDALANVQKVSANSAKIAAELEEVVSKVNSNDNALGKLLADTTFASRMEETMISAQSASAKLDENMEAMQHNFLLRGYFRKKEKRERREAEANSAAVDK
ncbi:MlaD family protein [Dawidia soli]|uniref:MCE family protein n=1 Tax=Dawidia soli TaxID=2782352 RepID=A0AAP2GI64_9BACT|nr:MlaD family protein [Dawidia soli]MBT1686693.1 MCE family protein [Dawidia soli]